MDRQVRGDGARGGPGGGMGAGIAVGAGGVLVVGAVAVVIIAAVRGPSPSPARDLPPVGAPVTAPPTAPALEQKISLSVPTTAPAPVSEVAPDHPKLAADTLYVRAAPAVVRIGVRAARCRGLCMGRGFFVSAGGLLVTTHPVIAGGAFATAETSDGTTLFVEGVLADDPAQDLALLKVKASGLSCLG